MREEENSKQRVLLVGVDTGEEEDFDRSMEELGSLAEACDMQVAGIITQRMEAVHKALYIGSGKVKEVKEFAHNVEADIICFDNALSPSQIRNLGDELELPILDRTNLILDIFATRAQTREAKLQVETSRLQYLLPRLVGMRDSLSRQGGGSGSMSNKGAGEKKLELDRRKIEHRIAELRKELEDIAKERITQRKKRAGSRTPQVALVGYTNAGKSTIMNQMVERYGDNPAKKVLEKDMLFATLETAIRTIESGDNKPFFLADTVGFIHKLPHGLVKAFQSTLEEVKYADLLVQVVDFSDSHYKQQMEVTAQTLKELEAGDIPMIYVYNKADLAGVEQLPKVREQQIYMSAVNGIGIEELAKMIQDKVYAGHVTGEFLIPYQKGSIASYFCDNAKVLIQEYREDGIYMQVECYRQDIERFREYCTSED
ncbi:MAG: GTPase HflX [Lachnospiraceae bacterium]|nr:GTPase HflX [Lachnospiraceae bacterium]